MTITDLGNISDGRHSGTDKQKWASAVHMKIKLSHYTPRRRLRGEEI
jgi:hypothetical protein